MVGGTEFAYGEFHISENTAGIILLGNHAFLIGYTIFGGTDEVMGQTYELHDREDAESYREVSFYAVMIAERPVKAAHDRLRNILNAAATITAGVTLVLFDYLG